MNAQSKLFETALGIKKPLFISSIDFNSALGELHIHIDFMRGGRFAVPSVVKKNAVFTTQLIKSGAISISFSTSAISILETQRLTVKTVVFIYTCLYGQDHEVASQCSLKH